MAGRSNRRAAVVYHPAGPDTVLADVLQDIELGRWRALRALLEDASAPDLRTSRTQLLASAAAGSRVLDVWALEEPRHPGLQVLQARVAVDRAVKAHTSGHPERVALIEHARRLCWDQVNSAPWDPVPVIGLLALAQTDPRQERPEHRQSAPDRMLPPGPWELLREADRREPGCREAYHRMLRYWQVQVPHQAQDFAQYAMSGAPDGSPLLLLPLYITVEHYRSLRDQGVLSALQRSQWAYPPLDRWTDATFSRWFRRPGSLQLPTDLNHLAHALVMGQRTAEAGEVFDAIGPYATVQPWGNCAPRGSDHKREFLLARSQCPGT